jgi:hypothetical protein
LFAQGICDKLKKRRANLSELCLHPISNCTFKKLTEFFFVYTFFNTASFAAPHADSIVSEDAGMENLKDKEGQGNVLCLFDIGLC